MKTLLCVIAALALLTLPVLAETTIDTKGSRIAAGYIDTGSAGNNTTGAFAIPDVKLQTNVKVDNDTTAVVRLDLTNGMVNANVDYAYIKLDNLINNLTGSKGQINPEVIFGRFKADFGEETWSNNPVEGALITNSVANVNGYDEGLQVKQQLPIDLPVILAVSFALLNGDTAAGDANGTKAYNLKVSGQMKNAIGPGGLAFSLSRYDSGVLEGVTTSAMGVGGVPATYAADWRRMILELNVRYDLLEGAQKFDPSKSPLSADAKGVFRLAYGQGGDSGASATKRTYTYIMLDGIFNVNNKMYAAFRYSYTDVDIGLATATDPGKTTRISIGGGYRLNENAILKAEYTINQEEEVATNPKLENDQVGLLLTLKW
ncbi:MAG: hypothetical protein QME51_06940 [Planctomycetota bacterium]|nr:hypothetical protein [Planctomycetota bacterium]MDI6788089.1 hypothetical protein [Planctomycetota bacterium]